MGDRKLLKNVITNYVPYESLSYKLNGQFGDTSNSQSFNGTLRIRKDSLVWASLSVALGVELARIQIRKDSVYFMNRIKNEYFIKDIEMFERMYQIDFTYGMLQNILTNEIFLYAENDENSNARKPELEEEEPGMDEFKKTFIADTDSNQYILKTHRKRKLKKQTRRNKPGAIVQTFTVIPDIFKISSVTINEISEKRQLTINYSKYILNGIYMMPHEIKLSISNKKKSVHLSLELTKITINPDVTYSFNIPEKYKRIEISE